MTAIRCISSPAAPCQGRRVAVAGGKVRVRGRDLQESRSVVFRGRRGRGDDVAARVGHVGPRHLEVGVPLAARTGPIALVTADGRSVSAARRLRVRPLERLPGDVFFAGDARRPSLSFDATAGGPVTVEVLVADTGAVVRRLTVQARPGSNTVGWGGRLDSGWAPNGRYTLRLAADAEVARAQRPAPFALVDHIFPIRGRHDLGQSETNNFGGGRGHRGQDMFAACGTPLVAARAGRVRQAGFNGSAGNYVVISSKRTGLDYVYMHMRRAPLVKPGDRVTTRQPIGEVGDSGNASGCHLHFELWTAPGWYAGGEPVDPIDRLRDWDAWS